MNNLKKNDLTELIIEDMSSEGLGIGHASGMAVFVKDAVIGDRVRAKIVKVKKSCAFARLEEILSPGPDRVEPICPAARRCGGCQIQELSYPAQLRFKERKVRENLARIGGLSFSGNENSSPGHKSLQERQGCLEEDDVFQPIIGMKNPWHYRNKAQFPVGKDKNGKIIAGFYAGRTHNIIDCHRCEIGIDENRIILEAVISWMEKYRVQSYDEETGKGEIRHVCTRAGFSTGELMVVIAANAFRLKEEQKLVEMLLESADQSAERTLDQPAERTLDQPADQTRGQPAGQPRFGITSIVLNTNREKTNVILGRKNRVLYGRDYIEDRIDSITYRISAGSFYQVNPVQTAVLYRTALEYAALTGQETVWDLYCGTGTISLFLAQRAKRVVGIEVIPEAVDNAKQNALQNHIDNCEFITGKAEELAGDLPPADVVVVDPPRKGLDKTLIDTILRVSPDRIVYVSCDSATLARDLALLVQGGYQIRKVQPVDQFCHTVHVETVALMTRQKG